MRFVVAPRVAARRTCCDCCERPRRCARVPVVLDGVLKVTLDVCSGCARAMWDAAKESRR